MGGTASSCLNGRGQRSEGLLPRSPCRRPGRWPRRCHLLKQILCGSCQSITIAARWATYKNILHFLGCKIYNYTYTVYNTWRLYKTVYFIDPVSEQCRGRHGGFHDDTGMSDLLTPYY